MNSMRLLLLLTFVLYETQCAPSIKPLKFLKSLLSKHFQSTTEQPLLEEEIYPAYKCDSIEEGAINDAVIEWNRQVFLVNEKPILIEVGNVEPIQNLNRDKDLAVNPEINPEVNCDENEEVNLEVISEEDLKQNPELSPEVKHQNVYEKDLNTEWLFGENTSERLPEIDVTVGVSSIKDKIINKINMIKSKLKFKNRPVIPIVELVEENKTNQEISSVRPTTTLEPISIKKQPTTVEYITTVQPVTTTHQYTTTVQPITSTHQYTTTVQPGTSAQPIIPTQYTSTVKPDIYMPNVQINGGIESQVPIITIPTKYQIPLQQRQIYNSDPRYPLWLNSCPPPLSHQICLSQNSYYATNPIYANTWDANQFTLDNVPYNTPDHQNQKINNGLTKVINYIKIDATQPVNQVKPNQDEQRIHYMYDDSVYQNPTPFYYVPQAVNPESQPEIVFPSSDDVYSKSTMQPIVVYSSDESILPVNQVDQTQATYNLDQLLEPATVNSYVNDPKSPSRGDIPIGEDFNSNTNYDQLEGDSSKYTLKERRHVGHYNELVSKKNNQNVPVAVSEISSSKPVSEQAETETSANKIETPTVTETEKPATKIIETHITKIEKPVVKIETPAITVTEISHPKFNNVDVDV
ncbi:uncharacterized protein LOC112594889 [Melanaphis sacchari]|uniref:uncharacterized protein LOC112594889 n=1 Tax=Melanaphis sacchari TaxID=742174 RepID=UPI000DC12EDD|nr:uncharacterized protein LOC112594889 [Melanaphis sacchari]